MLKSYFFFSGYYINKPFLFLLNGLEGSYRDCLLKSMKFVLTMKSDLLLLCERSVLLPPSLIYFILFIMLRHLQNKQKGG